jgi:poly(3-hydroxybutyrate) depolymerase
MPMSVVWKTALSLSARCAALALLCTGCPDLWSELRAHRDHGHHGHHGRKPVASAAGSGSGEAGSGAPTDSSAPRIPSAQDACPELRTGTIELRGAKVELWVGTRQPGQHGPLLVYWHGTGSVPSEATTTGAGFADVLAAGGLVAALHETTARGVNGWNGTWYSGDYEVVDELVACAVKQLDIDVRRIYTTGCSAGGVQAGALAYARSSYIAAASPNSGGTLLPAAELESSAHVPAMMTVHGRSGTDVVIVDFAEASRALASDVVAKGGFAVDCDHGGGHCAAPPAARAAQWQFLNDHPFGVEPEPYASGLPPAFPTYCSTIPQ